jgi:hypothetical protein
MRIAFLLLLRLVRCSEDDDHRRLHLDGDELHRSYHERFDFSTTTTAEPTANDTNVTSTTTTPAPTYWLHPPTPAPTYEPFEITMGYRMEERVYTKLLRQEEERVYATFGRSFESAATMPAGSASVLAIRDQEFGEDLAFTGRRLDALFTMMVDYSVHLVSDSDLSRISTVDAHAAQYTRKIADHFARQVVRDYGIRNVVVDVFHASPESPSPAPTPAPTHPCDPRERQCDPGSKNAAAAIVAYLGVAGVLY